MKYLPLKRLRSNQKPTNQEEIRIFLYDLLYKLITNKRLKIGYPCNIPLFVI